MRSLLFSKTFNPTFYSGWKLIKELRIESPSRNEMIEKIGFITDVFLSSLALVMTIVGLTGILGEVVLVASILNIIRIVGTILPAYISPPNIKVLVYNISYVVIHMFIILLAFGFIIYSWQKGAVLLVAYMCTTRVLSLTYIEAEFKYPINRLLILF